MEIFSVKRYAQGDLKNKSLIVFPHWGATAWPYQLFAKSFSREYHVIVYYYPTELLSADIERTSRYFLWCEETALRDMQCRLRNIAGVYGVSLGSAIATRVANAIAQQCRKPPSLILNVSGASFPEAVWYGDATQHIRRQFQEQGVLLSTLDNEWGSLSPHRNLEYLRGANILFFAAHNDETIHPPNVRRMIEVLRTYPNAVIQINHLLGHRAAGVKNLLRVHLVRKFLRDHNS